MFDSHQLYSSVEVWDKFILPRENTIPKDIIECVATACWLYSS